MQQEKFKVIGFIRDLINNVDKNLENFPKKDIEIKNRIRNASYDLLELAYEANTTEEITAKISIINKCIAKAKVIDFLVNLSYEKQIINNLFDFGDTQAKDVMIPRIDMTTAAVDSDYNQIISLFRDTQYTRLPIYEESADNIIGILNIKDIILSQSEETFCIKNIMREPFFTYEHKTVSELFKEMQRGSHSIAIVLDEYGSAAGMITTEDLLEEIVGEIRDEYDKDETEPFVKLADNVYRVSASYKLDDINDAIGTNLHSDENDSIGGYIIEQLDRFPKRGDRLKTGNIEFIIEHATKARIVSIIMKIKQS